MNATTTSLAMITSLAAGVVVGYVIGTSRSRQKYSELADAEIAEAREYFTRFYKEYPTPEEAVAELIEPATAPEADPEFEKLQEAIRPYIPSPTHILDEADGVIRVVSEDEYIENAEGFIQVPLDYYAGDDILVDEDGQIVIAEYTVGELTPEMFTDGTLLVFNSELGTAYEITLQHGDYMADRSGDA